MARRRGRSRSGSPSAVAIDMARVGRPGRVARRSRGDPASAVPAAVRRARPHGRGRRARRSTSTAAAPAARRSSSRPGFGAGPPAGARLLDGDRRASPGSAPGTGPGSGGARRAGCTAALETAADLRAALARGGGAGAVRRGRALARRRLRAALRCDDGPDGPTADRTRRGVRDARHVRARLSGSMIDPAVDRRQIRDEPSGRSSTRPGR